MTIIIIAFGLAMDAFAVSVASGIAVKDLKINDALKIALSFGVFQAFMPAIGWLVGFSIIDFITGIDHWVAFFLLAAIGSRMIYESFRLEKAERIFDPTDTRVLLLLSIATSIDAFAVGMSFAILKLTILKPIIIIGSITFVLSLIGVLVGKRVGHFFERRIELLGGLILIGIGIKILIEHLSR